MPRITAPTVQEHRERQRRKILDSAHELLRKDPTPPSLAAVARGAGISRSALYIYFDSRETLLYALVEDVFPRWTARVTQAMTDAPTVADRVRAYALANLELVDEGAHAVSGALAALAPGEELGAQAQRMHDLIRAPLVDTIQELGIASPEQVADLFNALVHGATRMLEQGQPFDDVLADIDAILVPFIQAHTESGQ